MSIPPRAVVTLPWDDAVEDPVAALAEARSEHGDTFVVEAAQSRWWFVFGPIGVRSFYELAEDDASKGVADWQMLRRKLPPELFTGRRMLPHELWSRHATESYLGALERSIDVVFVEMGDAGEFELFDWTRRLGHRMGLASWGGVTPSIDPMFDQLLGWFDVLDGAAAFVDPAATRAVAAGGYVAERAALSSLEACFGDRVEERLAAGVAADDLFDAVVDRWRGDDPVERRIGVTRDVVLIHLGSMSNLFAALAWTVADLLAHPAVQHRVLGGEVGLAERCALESTRLAQRSLMSRAVLRPVRLTTELGEFTVEPGDSIATLLPLTNTSAAPGLDIYDPDRWDRRRLRATPGLAARELVATFGHGRHTCPAQPFSLAAMTATVTRLFDRYALDPRYERVDAVRGQIGGVARSAAPCHVRYSLR